MDFLQVALHQGSRPDRGAVAVVARVVLDDGVDQRIDDPQGRRGPPAARGIEQAVGQVQVGPVRKRLDPVVDRLAAHPEQVSDRGDRFPLMEPQQALGAPQLRCIGRLTQELQQSASFPGAELEWSHKPPPAGEKCKAHSFVKELLSFYLVP